MITHSEMHLTCSRNVPVDKLLCNNLCYYVEISRCWIGGLSAVKSFKLVILYAHTV